MIATQLFLPVIDDSRAVRHTEEEALFMHRPGISRNKLRMVYLSAAACLVYGTQLRELKSDFDWSSLAGNKMQSD